MLGDDARAVTDFTRAIELLPTYTKAYNNRALSFQALGQFAEAVSDYMRAIELDPSYGLAYMNLGALLLKLDRKEDALKVFERAAQLGIPQATQIVSQIRQMPGMRPAHMAHSDPEAAFEAFLEAFQRARSLEELRMIVQRFPMLNPHGFIQLVEPLSARMSPELRREFTMRLRWLQQIAERQ